VQAIFGTVALTIEGWKIGTGIAASILFLEEGRKLIVALAERMRAWPY